MDPEVRKRLNWINLFNATKDAGLTCRKCGISRPTLRKWLKRYQDHGLSGLASKSRRPFHSPTVKVHEEQEAWIHELRKEGKLGVCRIQHEIERQYCFHLSLATIQKVLKKHNLSIIRCKRRNKQSKLYSKSMPGECVQIDTIKIAPSKYQHTARAPTLTAPAYTPSPEPSLTPMQIPSPSPTTTSTPADTPTPRPTLTPAVISTANAASLQRAMSFPVSGL